MKKILISVLHAFIYTTIAIIIVTILYLFLLMIAAAFFINVFFGVGRALLLSLLSFLCIFLAAETW